MNASIELYVNNKILKILRDIINLETSPSTYKTTRIRVETQLSENCTIKITLPLQCVDVTSDTTVIDLNVLHNIGYKI